MKKVITLVTLVGFVSLTSCGPSKEEIEKKAKFTADSLALETAKAEAAAAQEKMIADSTAKYNADMEVKEKEKEEAKAKHKEKAAPKHSSATNAKPKADAKPTTVEPKKEEPKSRGTRTGKVK